MKVSINWLKKIVNVIESNEELAERFTLAGLEVDNIKSVAKPFDKIVVGRVAEVSKHPDADKLKVCKVDVGSNELLQIVCGANNVAVNIKVPVALVGARMANDQQIEEGKLRGVASFGMLCSADELSLSSSSEGLMLLDHDAPIGKSVFEYLELDDKVMEIELTPNRADCASMLGVAREYAALTGNELIESEQVSAEITSEKKLAVKNLAISSCPKYVARIIEDIDIKKPTPLWMQEKLRRAGCGSVNVVVDVLNYVMFELGQPMHAYSLDSIEGDITIRTAKKNEKLTLLNDETKELDVNTLVIADKKEIISIAGVMGSKSSAVSSNTTSIVIESALFTQTALAGTARKYGLHTDASYRFERGVDPSLQERALERASVLIKEIAGGKIAAICVSEAIKENSDLVIELRLSKITKILGISFSKEEVAELLDRLNIKYTFDKDLFICKAPSYRLDLKLEVDLIEELIRVKGFDSLPTKYNLPSESAGSAIDISSTLKNRIVHYLQDRSYSETISYSFTARAQQELFYPMDKDLLIDLINPLSKEFSTLRAGVLPSLVNTAKYNIARGNENVKLFEFGKSYKRTKENKVVETDLLAGLCITKVQKNWIENKAVETFYSVKTELENIFKFSDNIDMIKFIAAKHSAMHPRRCAQILHNNKVVGYIGNLDPRLAQKLNLSKDTVLFELEASFLLKKQELIAKKPSKFPSVVRDLALVVKNAIFVGDIVDFIQQELKTLLSEIKVFDLYQGEGVKEGSKSVGLSLKFGHEERTVTDQEIDLHIINLCNVLTREFDAVLRD